MLLKKTSFKIIIFFAILLAMLFSFTACAPQKRGNFYTLQEAYDQGLLTIDDLKNIAYYQNGESPDESFVPILKNPETLSSKTENAIKESRAYYYRNKEIGAIEDAKPQDYTIVRYLGTYKNSVAIIIMDYRMNYLDINTTETIEGIPFKYSSSNKILIFKAD